MTAAIVEMPKEEVLRLIAEGVEPEYLKYYNRHVNASARLWVGYIDGKLVCAWALMPLTLISDRAYLWLHTTKELEGNEFVFVRQSKLAVDTMLQHYPYLTGHVKVGNDRAVRWLRWLGAAFAQPHGDLIPFTIRNKADG